MDWNYIVPITILVLPLLLMAVSFFLIIPSALEQYQQWQATKNYNLLSTSILLGFTAIILLAITYLIYMYYTLRYYTVIPFVETLPIILYILFVYLTQRLFLPKALRCFQCWKTTNRHIYFSLTTIYFFISFYLISFIFLTIIPLVWIHAH